MPSETPEKLNLFKLHRAEYAAGRTPKLVDVGPASYLSVQGSGEPGSEVFQARLQALYGVGYTLKFNSKASGRDYTVGKLEGLYGVDGQSLDDLERLPLEQWNWRMLMRVPDFTGEEDLEEARETLAGKGKEGDFERVILESLDEGTCIQMLHVGPYEEISQATAAMAEVASRQGLEARRWHHEVYLSDPRRVPPERLRTILRRPVSA